MLFTQTPMPLEDGDEKIIMKITGVLVDLLVNNNPDLHEGFAVCENGKKVTCVQVLKATYGQLLAATLWYNKFREDLEKTGFEFNPCDPCVSNRHVEGSQHTVRFHVDDAMSSHVDSEVNDDFETAVRDLWAIVQGRRLRREVARRRYPALIESLLA